MEQVFELPVNDEENRYKVKQVCEVNGVNRKVLYKKQKEKWVMQKLKQKIQRYFIFKK